jgi:hypothetical protein
MIPQAVALQFTIPAKRGVSISASLFRRLLLGMAIASLLLSAVPSFAQGSKPKKVLIETDMEGASGIYAFDLQCVSWTSPLWECPGLGSEPRTYGESILKTCEFCVRSPLACVSGVTGADLKGRIVRIMSQVGRTTEVRKIQ